MEVSLPYEKKRLRIQLDTCQQINLPHTPRIKKTDWLRFALAAPIDTPPLNKIVKHGQSIVIITSDITRPCPSHLILPLLMEELKMGGVRDEDVTIIFALGIHRPHTPKEQAQLLGPEIYANLHCVDSDPDEVVYIGKTTRFTPIEVFRLVADATFRIAIGNVEPHYFAGYTGGAKALVPGVCSQRTIRHNHAMLLDPQARVGILENNPVREDIEEGAALIGIDFILNVVLDESYKIVAAASGHPVQAHRWICRKLESFRKVQVDELADIVIVSSGGHPKDINLYQAQKALDNAAMLVRPGGIIVWVAECPEGFGNKIFEQWLIEFSAEDIIAKIQQQFVLGGHKAAANARVLNHAQVSLVSLLPPENVQAAGMIPYENVETAILDASTQIGSDAVITVIPDGAVVIPSISEH